MDNLKHIVENCCSLHEAKQRSSEYLNFPRTTAPNAFFHLGGTELRFNCTTGWLAEQPLGHHCVASCSSKEAGLDSNLQEWSSLVEEEHRYTLLVCPSYYYLIFRHNFFFLTLPCKKKKIVLGIKYSLGIGKLMLVSGTKWCAKQKSFPWGKDLQVMPNSRCLFLFQAVEIFGTMRPWSLTGVSWHHHSLHNAFI